MLVNLVLLHVLISVLLRIRICEEDIFQIWCYLTCYLFLKQTKSAPCLECNVFKSWSLCRMPSSWNDCIFMLIYRFLSYATTAIIQAKHSFTFLDTNAVTAIHTTPAWLHQQTISNDVVQLVGLFVDFDIIC